MAISLKSHVAFAALVTLTLIYVTSSLPTAETLEPSETSEEIWEELDNERNAVDAKIASLRKNTSSIPTVDLIAMDKDLDADIERDAYEIVLEAAEADEDSAESAEEEDEEEYYDDEEEEAKEEDEVIEKMASPANKTAVPAAKSGDLKNSSDPEIQGEDPNPYLLTESGPWKPTEPGNGVLADRRYIPRNSGLGNNLYSNRNPSNGDNSNYFDIRPLNEYLKTCDTCYEHVGDNLCPMHQPALELKKWALELEEVLSHGCMKPENCDKQGTCCLARNDRFEPTIVRMTQMLKDMFLAVQKNCDKCTVEEWSPWGAWDRCSATCGVGFQMRARTCSAKRGSNCDGDATEKKQCFNEPCCGDSLWGNWCSWSECSGSCGGMKSRTRSCVAQRGCPNMNCAGPDREEVQCGSPVAPMNGNWGTWAPWVNTGTCGQVIKTRSRQCNRPPPNACGADCRGDREQTTIEDMGPCTCKTTKLSQWSSWSSCSATCGNGLKTKTRRCEISVDTLRGGRSCPREECSMSSSNSYRNTYDLTYGNGGGDQDLKQETTCTNRPCCGDYQWSSWSNGECSATCGRSTRPKTRRCEMVVEGDYCPQEPFQCRRSDSPQTERDQCNSVPCPTCIERDWSPWGSWSNCPLACGQRGSQSKTRRCEIRTNGIECRNNRNSQCRGEDREERQCPFTPCRTCRITEWAAWTPWSRCSRTCDGGQQERSRACRVIKEGDDCPVRGDLGLQAQCTPGRRPEMQERECNLITCPVESCRETNWSSWGRWGPCNCDTMSKERSRTCQVTVEGVNCPNRPTSCDPYRERTDSQSEPCQDQSCCEIKAWATWTPWSSCPVSCMDQFSTRGAPQQTRQRQCRVVKQGQQCGRSECNGLGRANQPCNVPMCVVCKVTEWSSWGRWGRCDCDTNTQSREKTCETITEGSDGRDCRISMRCNPLFERVKTEDRSCTDPSCCVDAVWTSWGSWSNCENRCGSEEVSRNRVCDRSRKTSCGKDCVGPSRESKTKTCGPPEVYGRFREWGSWSACSASCGPGSRSRNRECTVTDQMFAQDRECNRPCAGRTNEINQCNQGPCRVCEVKAWSSWQPWSRCSASCGPSGSRSRTRQCITRVPGDRCPGSGNQCRGLDEEPGQCLPGNPPCEAYTYKPWEDWCPCDCKTGLESRRRSCFLLDPRTRVASYEVDLIHCQEFGPARQEQYCDVKQASCPVCITECEDEQGRPLRDGDYPSCAGCSDYISCRNGRSEVYRCDKNGDNKEWDSYVRKCVTAPSPSCSLNEPVNQCNRNTENGKYHSSRGCTFYVECINGETRQRECRQGKEFDAHSGKCKSGRSMTCIRQIVNFNRAVIGGSLINVQPNDAPADMFYDEKNGMNSTDRRLAYEKAMKEKTDDDLTAAKNAKRIALGLDTPAASGPEEKFLRRVNPECVTDCEDRPAGHYGSCRACEAYVICTKHGRLRERRCHGKKEFDVAKKKCVTASQTCVLKGIIGGGNAIN